MAFPSHTTSYGHRTGDRYRRAARVWDDRIGSARVQTFHWRLVALLALAAVLALIAGLIYVAARTQVRTYVIEIDSAGLPARITLVNGTYQPTESQIAYFLGQLVRLVRARSLDPVVLRGNWTTAYRFLAGDAINTMNVYARRDAESAAALGKPVARTVEISNVLPQSEHTYQVRWSETRYVAGVPQPPESYTGLFQVDLKPPSTEEDVFHNPLGVYVVSFSWSREFDTLLSPSVQPIPSPESETSHDDTPN